MSKRRVGGVTLPAVGVGDDLQAERVQDAFDLRVVDRHAKHARQPRAAQRNGWRLRQVFRQHGFDHRARRAAGDLDDQARRAFDRDARQLRIDAALETMPGIGMQAELAAAADDRIRREMRGFEEHVPRRIGHARVEAAHDAGQRDRAVGIGDDEEFADRAPRRGRRAVSPFRQRARDARRPGR